MEPILRLADVVILDDGTRSIVIAIAVGTVELMTLYAHPTRLWMQADAVRRARPGWPFQPSDRDSLTKC